MNGIQVLILSLVEGLTEFLPISSTAHLIFASKLLNIPQTDFQKLFEVFIQSGAILAVMFLYSQYLLKHRQVVKNVLVSFLPTAAAGFLLYKVIKAVFFESYYLILGVLFFVGLFFVVFEYLIAKKKINLTKRIGGMSDLEAVVIGVVQSLAVVPGVSRAGAVIVGMMFLGYRREEAATYSFLLAVPTIVVAGFFDLFKMRNIVFANITNINLLLVGSSAAFVFAYFSVHWLIGYLQKNSLTAFGIYRIIVALVLFFMV